MEVSGVFNSCDTMLSKSDFMRSATARSAAILFSEFARSSNSSPLCSVTRVSKSPSPMALRAVRQQADLASESIGRIQDQSTVATSTSAREQRK